MAVATEARNAGLGDIVALLQAQQLEKLDAVVPATKMKARGGLMVVDGMSIFGETVLRPTDIFDGQIAEKLGIPVKYVRKLREERPDLYDANVNGWLHGNGGAPGTDFVVTPEGAQYPTVGADPRKFYLRAFNPTDGGEGVARALHSDRFSAIDNLDVIMSSLTGIKESGVEAECVDADLSERRMVVRFAAPGIAVMAPELLKGYNSPIPGWGSLDRIRDLAENEGKGYAPGKEPVVFAGFELSNSETGFGAFQLRPRLVVKMCKNGLTIDLVKFRKVHLGAQLDEGIQWTADTETKALELIQAQVRDAVKQFLSVEFLTEAVADLEKVAGVEVADAVKTVELVAKTLKFTDAEQEGILNHFIKGGQITAGGVLQAVTSYAQVVASPDAAYDLENVAVQAMTIAADANKVAA